MLKKEKIVLSNKLLVLTIKMKINNIIFKFLLKKLFTRYIYERL
jgi:hypothetical protein